MARRLPERVFDPNRPVIVRRFFVAAGRHWEPGDAFDWRRLAVSQRRTRQLFDVGKLMHAEGGTIIATPSPAPTPTAEPPAPISETVEPADDLSDLGMKELRQIAEEEGAPSRVSRAAQREAIRQNRAENASGLVDGDDDDEHG